MSGDWPPCGQCGGIRIEGGDSCLAHAKPGERAAALTQFSESGELDVRGVTISKALLKEIFRAAPHDKDDHLAFSAARFDRSTFEGGAWFIGARFEDDASFTDARFEGDAGFDGVTFKRNVWFVGATFEGDALHHKAARFDRATFEGRAEFVGARFAGDASFNQGVKFEGVAGFVGATFEGDAGFDRATFKDASFDRATFEGPFAQFGGARFEGRAGFSFARFKGTVVFNGARFEGDMPVLGPMAVGGRLYLNGVQFASLAQIETETSILTCRRGRFPGGVRFDVRRALVRLDESDLSMPSLLTGPPVSDPAGITGQPKLLSLQGANVAGLALANVNLASCRFAGTHNLDKLRLEADTVFGLSPAVAGWERRQVIAEETAWRAARTRPGERNRWERLPWPEDWEGDMRVPDELSVRIPADEPEVLSPGAIGGLYRALRKGREDAKDVPGAADFYYGEMEMRRHDRGTGTNRWRGRVSRIVLTVYWLVSGYGQRAWRSLAALAVVMAVFAALLRLWGFAGPTSYWKSLLFSFRSTISLTDSSVSLTAWGGLFQACLRLTGPVLLALALLALRERVKR